MMTIAQAAIPSHWPQPRMSCTSLAPGIPTDDGFDPETGSDESANAGVATNSEAMTIGGVVTARIRSFRDIAGTSGGVDPPGWWASTRRRTIREREPSQKTSKKFG